MKITHDGLDYFYLYKYNYKQTLKKYIKLRKIENITAKSAITAYDNNNIIYCNGINDEKRI